MEFGLENFRVHRAPSQTISLAQLTTMPGLLAIPEFPTPTGLTQHEMLRIPVLVLMGYSGLNGSFPQGPKDGFFVCITFDPLFHKTAAQPC